MYLSYRTHLMLQNTKQNFMITNKPKRREINLAIQELENELLIYDTLINKAICLNSTSAMVWQACDGNRDVPGISKYLSAKFNNYITEEMIWLALDLLNKSNLIDNKDEFPSFFAGLSRREIIRKVGLATVVALPVISAIVAPTSSRAASNAICRSPGENPCVTAADCDAFSGDICVENCCRFGEPVDGGVCLPGNPCSPPPCGVFC